MRSPWIVPSVLLAWAGIAFAAAVDANTASVDALQTVRGVGPAIAQRIVDERRRGPYSSLDDLQARVRGVGEGNVRKMSAAGLTVGGAARVPAVGGGVGRVHEVVPAVGPRPAAIAAAPDTTRSTSSVRSRAAEPRGAAERRRTANTPAPGASAR